MPPLQKSAKNRYWELDFFRGFGILGMVIYHALWNLWYFELIPWDMVSVNSKRVSSFGATLFLLIVGVSLHIRVQKSLPTIDFQRTRKKITKRGAKLLGLGFLITLVTSFIVQGDIYFGILHLIGVSTMLSTFFVLQPKIAGILGAILIVFGQFAKTMPLPHLYLLFLGIGRADFTMLDYKPIIPWFGVVLLGIYLGSLVYPKGNTRIRFKKPNAFFQAIAYIGGYGLAIYMVHQPLLFAMTYLLKRLLENL